MKQLNIQQGDVLLRPVNVLSTQGYPRVTGRLVIHQGEHGGHAHVIEDDEAELVMIGHRMLLNLGKAATMVHEEHKSVEVPAGTYDVGQVQAQDYAAQTKSVVED